MNHLTAIQRTLYLSLMNELKEVKIILEEGASGSLLPVP